MSEVITTHLTEQEIETDIAVRHCYSLSKDEDAAILKQHVSKSNYLIDLVGSDGQSALHIAAASENLLAVKNLLTSGWSVNLQDGDDKTALHIICLLGWYEALVLVLAHGADQALKDSKGRIALHLSTYDKQIRCMALLVQQISPQLVNTPDEELMTPLHWAAFHNRPDHVQLLISKGANLFCADVDKKTALHWACQKGSKESVEVLVQEGRGTNLVNVRDQSGKGALHYAAAAGYHEVIGGLSKSHALNIHLDDPSDRQPLHWAAAFGRLKCVQLLLQLGADPTAHDIDARNALHHAIKTKNQECAQYLKAVLKAMKSKQKSGGKHCHHRVGAAPTESDSYTKDRHQDETGEDNRQELLTTEMGQSSSKTKLPPLRGTKHMNGVIPHSEKDEEDQAIALKLRTSNLKPINKALLFKPTTSLYSGSETSEL